MKYLLTIFTGFFFIAVLQSKDMNSELNIKIHITKENYYDKYRKSDGTLKSKEDIKNYVEREQEKKSISCDKLIQVIKNIGNEHVNNNKLFDKGIPKCINEEFPEEWIKKKVSVNKYAFTKCTKQPCNISQFPFIGQTSRNEIGHILGTQKIFLKDEVTIIDGHSKTSKPWHKIWFSFSYKNKTFYISKLNIEK
ncbi:MAG: hypothetical protein CBB97_21095 [Candidatus Endolissoclinum sp. TMED37]|nr:MAG: hypothetical protein CBB97_21095 [Candidatus Endolissoclinum sp. TMED37]|tara:strand:- start:907 stop:1488 length:582 start_codon:yes stop_codon:yes gene_type:complete